MATINDTKFAINDYPYAQYVGTSTTYVTPKWYICTACGGDGTVSCCSSCSCCSKTCTACNGTGKIRSYYTTWNGPLAQPIEPLIKYEPYFHISHDVNTDLIAESISDTLSNVNAETS